LVYHTHLIQGEYQWWDGVRISAPGFTSQNMLPAGDGLASATLPGNSRTARIAGDQLSIM
jgi:hypothetical protein